MASKLKLTELLYPTSTTPAITINADDTVTFGAPTTTITNLSATSITDSGNLTFTGTGNRITGDFTNATIANRVLLQSSTSNGQTAVGLIPNGTSTQTQLIAYNSTDPANSSYIQTLVSATEARINSGQLGTGTNLPMTFYTGGGEKIRIDSSGNLLVGTQSSSFGQSGFIIDPNFNSAASSGMAIQHVNGSANGSTYVSFAYNAGQIGNISQNGTTGVLYNLTSDHRLKNDPQPLTDSKDFIMALQPKKLQWWDGSGEGVGFIAHEFMAVAKYSGNGEKDAVDADNKPVYQSIQPSSSEVMANLIGLVQEQQALITQLQADVAALKGN